MQNLIESLAEWMTESWNLLRELVTTPSFYAQLAGIIIAISVAASFTWFLVRRLRPFTEAQADGLASRFWRAAAKLSPLLFPILAIAILGVAVAASDAAFSRSWLIRIAQGLAVVGLLAVIIRNFVQHQLARSLLAWIAIPIATLYVFGWLDDVTSYLDQISLNVGNIDISLFALLRTLIFGVLLFWLGAVSNVAGKEAIRTQEALEAGTRELFAKLFEIALFFVIFVLLLQVMGINLTTLAVFGGALGIGLGFGLQQIASNFVSGIIILVDRSITIGDFVELEDGRSGTLRELNMRHGILETYDGKDIMVPNEQFITSSYTNWTHKDKRQRYALEFQVAYSTDLDLLFDDVRKVCADHPSVISGDDVAVEHRPDAEIAGFGESGIDILVEFWMEGIDDGKNRVGADLLHSIWRVIQEHGMQIPFPQREVRILRNHDIEENRRNDQTSTF